MGRTHWLQHGDLATRMESREVARRRGDRSPAAVRGDSRGAVWNHAHGTPRCERRARSSTKSDRPRHDATSLIFVLAARVPRGDRTGGRQRCKQGGARVLPIAVAGPRTCERDDTEYENKATDSECCCRCRHAMTWRGARVTSKCTGERKTSCVGAVASGRTQNERSRAQVRRPGPPGHTHTGPTSPKAERCARAGPVIATRMKNCL